MNKGGRSGGHAGVVGTSEQPTKTTTRRYDFSSAFFGGGPVLRPWWLAAELWLPENC